MSKQDIDPLADTVPPRHAYESDEEDEYTPFPGQPSAPDKVPVPQEVKIRIDDAKEQSGKDIAPSLILVSGVAGKAWAKGADLGEQTGRVVVENVQVGLIFRPSWAEATVLVSEVTTRLPTWAMHSYAEAILTRWEPSNVSILDIYATPAYITSQPVAHHDSPTRYLSIRPFGASNFPALNSMASFAPPNLIQGTSASFLSILALPEWLSGKDTATTLVLLPSRHSIPPAPTSLAPTNISMLSGGAEEEGWDAYMILAAHKVLLAAAGISGEKPWHDDVVSGKRSTTKTRNRAGDIGEGSMYI